MTDSPSAASNDAVVVTAATAPPTADHGSPARRNARRGGPVPSFLVVLAFAAPAIVLMSVFLIWPTIQNVRFSLYDWNGLSPGKLIGLGNYRELAKDSVFRSVIQHSLVLAIGATIGSMGLGVLWAYGIERRLPGWRSYRFLLFIPVVMPITVSALLWNLLLDSYGPIDSSLIKLGWSNPPDWLGDPSHALAVVVAVAIWQSSGFTMLIILGAMEDVPSELHDAASLDGASSLRRLVSIVLPYIQGTLGTLTIVQFIGLLKAFDIVFALTKGGPGGSTDILGTYLLQKAFKESRYGYGSAVAVVTTLIMFLISFIFYRRLLGKDSST